MRPALELRDACASNGNRAAGRWPIWPSVRGVVQSDDQQDRARGGQPDGGGSGAAGGRFRSDLRRPASARRGRGRAPVARRRPAGLARSRDGLSAQASLQPARPSRWRSSRSKCRQARRLRCRPRPTRAFRQAVWVQAGALVIVEGGERHELGAGDCLGFGPPSDVDVRQ